MRGFFYQGVYTKEKYSESNKLIPAKRDFESPFPLTKIKTEEKILFVCFRKQQKHHIKEDNPQN